MPSSIQYLNKLAHVPSTVPQGAGALRPLEELARRIKTDTVEEFKCEADSVRAQKLNLNTPLAEG